MSLSDNNQVTNSESICKFAESVKGYCSLIDRCDNLPFGTFILQLAESLAALYKDGFGLPHVELTNNEPGPLLKPDEWSRIFSRVQEKLADAVQYYKNHGTDEEYLSAVMLPDDLSDLYHDIKAGLIMFSRGTDEDILEAIWEWRFGFMGHYGRHMANAIHTVHLMLCDSLHYVDKQ